MDETILKFFIRFPHVQAIKNSCTPDACMRVLVFPDDMTQAGIPIARSTRLALQLGWHLRTTWRRRLDLHYEVSFYYWENAEACQTYQELARALHDHDSYPIYRPDNAEVELYRKKEKNHV